MWEMVEDNLTARIIACIIEVHRRLGPGFRERVYQRALRIELAKRRLAAESEKRVVIHYDGHEVGGHRIDLIVENSVILEVKTVDRLVKAHYAQVRSYLKASGLQTGLLVNFAGPRADYRRIEAAPDLRYPTTQAERSPPSP
jgi:GxxExxY protein